MLADGELVAFVATTDAARARDFYAGTLGLTVLDATDFGLLLDAGGRRLRIAVVGELTPASHTVLGWTVAQIDATVAALVAAGVTPIHYPGMGQDDRGVWRAPGGAAVAWFHDPDGNVLSVTQLDAPQEPRAA